MIKTFWIPVTASSEQILFVANHYGWRANSDLSEVENLLSAEEFVKQRYRNIMIQHVEFPFIEHTKKQLAQQEQEALKSIRELVESAVGQPEEDDPPQV